MPLPIGLVPYWRLTRDSPTSSVSPSNTLTQDTVETIPQSTAFLSHELLASFFNGILAAAQVSQHSFVGSKLIHRGGRHGNVLFQQVQHQFTHGIDLIGIGMLKEFLPFESIGFFQEGPQKRQLTSNAFHPGSYFPRFAPKFGNCASHTFGTHSFVPFALAEFYPQGGRRQQRPRLPPTRGVRRFRRLLLVLCRTIIPNDLWWDWPLPGPFYLVPTTNRHSSTVGGVRARNNER